MRIRGAHELGVYVRAQRRAAGWTQQDLAERALVSRRWLSDLESGKTSAEMGLVFKILDALGLYVDLQPVPPQDFDLDAYLDGFAGPPKDVR